MGIGGRGDLENACILQFLVGWQDAPHQRQNAFEKSGFIFFGEVSAFGDKGAERFLRQIVGIDPCQIKPNLQVAQVLLTEVFNC